MKKILVIQTAFIGDVILATALPASLKSYDETFCVDFLVTDKCATVLEDNPLINNVLLWDKSKKYKNLFSLIKKVRKEKYDLIINVHRFASSGLITVMGRAKHTVGFKKNPLSFLFEKKVQHEFNCHETERNHKLLTAVFPDIPYKKPHITPAKIDWLDLGIQEKYITISPGSVWQTKRYPIEKWREFINRLPADLQVIALGSEQDRELVDKIFTNDGKNRLNLCGKLSLRQSAMVMKNAVMNYTNDSAPTHLATAVDASVATIFCSTVPEFGFFPLSSNSHIIQINDKLYCRPCGVHGRKTCPEKHFRCAFDIKTEQLLKVLRT